MSTALRLVLVLLLALGAAGCTPAQAPPTTVELTVTSTPPAEPRRVEVPLGSEVTLQVASEVAEELHVHGYEIALELVAGESRETTFTANMAGSFEVETHEDPAVWLQLVVA